SCQVCATLTRLSLLKIPMAVRRLVHVRTPILAIFNGWKTGFLPITTHCRLDWKSGFLLACQGSPATHGEKRCRRVQIIYRPVLLGPELISVFSAFRRIRTISVRSAVPRSSISHIDLFSATAMNCLGGVIGIGGDPGTGRRIYCSAIGSC